MKSKKPALHIHSARENNLKSVTLEIPHNELTVVTGLSGSGKSSLAFDTVYAEGQRRYIETFSPYTRQFFDKVKKPDADRFEQVRPAIAIQQRTRITSARSTVGSLTNINDYLKILWFNLSVPTCPHSDLPLVSHTAASVADWIYGRAEGAQAGTLMLAAIINLSKAAAVPQISKGKKKAAKVKKVVGAKEDAYSISKLIESLLAAGFSRFFDESTQQLKQIEELTTISNNRVLVVLDRFRFSALPERKSLIDSISQAFNFSILYLPLGYKIASACSLIESSSPSQFEIHEFYSDYRCPKGLCEFPRIRQSLFSFNHPLGACACCKGFGFVLSVDPDKVIPNKNLSLKDNAIQCWGSKSTGLEHKELLVFCKEEKIPADLPWKDLSVTQQEKIFESKTKTFWGISAWFKWLERKTYKMHVRVFLSRYRSQIVCPECSGSRLVKAALAFKVLDKNLPATWQMPIGKLLAWLLEVEESFKARSVWSRALAEVVSALEARLRYLCDLGLTYLTLDRQARTLSGGETQRVNLAAALGSDLVSTQFVLDEPSVGLHPRDTARLIKAIRNLADKGNSVLVVEHDLDCIASADNIIEMGPKAGSAGGEVVFQGPAETWPGIDTSYVSAITADTSSLRGEKENFLSISCASARNLKGWDLEIPLGKFVCLSGPSGSGKSSLVHEVIAKAYQAQTLGLPLTDKNNQVSGFKKIEKFLVVDQAPLTKSPRANIATFSDIWEPVRKLLADTEAANSRGLSKSSFSFNVDGGRCPDCKGAGFIREDMQFLSDVYVPCDTCLGKRFKPVVLEVEIKGKSVADLLALSVEDAQDFFSNYPEIREAAKTLSLLGLGHLTLGHSLSELSGGEAQRLKLVPFVTAAAKKKAAEGSALLIFDEPTTGLHFHDVQRLISLLLLLKDEGHSVLCIEHNLSLLAASDYIVDLGPEGGDAGGHLIWQGHPANFLSNEAQAASITAKYLAKYEKDLHSNKIMLATQSDFLAEKKQTSSEPTHLEIKGAREHNLKNIDVSLPFNQMVAICGVSGSGKSSIAKDIIYAEGQRRYLDCLSPYARQFIKELKRPEIDEIRNVKPTICVYQHTFQPSKLSTVATMSEIYNYLRLLYAKVGTQYCPDHPDQQITPMSAEDMGASIKALPSKTVRLLAPIIKSKKGTHRAIFQRAVELEISQVRVDGIYINPAEVDASGGLTKTKPHTIEYVLAKFSPKTIPADLLAETIAQGLMLGAGTLLAITETEEVVLSSDRTCPTCKRGFFRPDPEDLSFNSKRGRCQECSGTGVAAKGRVCGSCDGARINSLGRSLRLGNLAIHEICALTVPELLRKLSKLSFQTESAKRLATPALKELESKAQMLKNMGLDYIALCRDCSSLSGGELQRLRLATAVGSSLSGALFIFDEPSAGLHPSDNTKVLSCLRSLCENGNSVLVIEHDKESILACDYVIDVGPGGGKDGGEITFSGSTKKFEKDSKSPTAIAFREEGAVRESRLADSNKSSSLLRLSKGNLNSIKNLSLSLPLQRMVTIAGVSGAGKSSLLHGIIRRTLVEGKKVGSKIESHVGSIQLGLEIDRILEVDQSPIGINSRSTPASYLKIWDHIRVLFANSIEAQSRGWTQSFFSYNAGKGRCPECQGLGQKKLEMSFLPDARVECESCEGKRFSDEALSVTYLGINAHQALSLSFEEAKSIFANHPKVQRAARLACELGLGYLTLGQSSTTLSGGESQRIKLVSELSAPARGHTLYILDEPTTGLHKNDVVKLIKILQQLVDRGNTVYLIEHDADIIANSDWIVEMGPGPGERGGKVVFEGSLLDKSKIAANEV